MGQGLLDSVFGVGGRAEHPVAVGVQLGAVSGHELAVGLLVTSLRGRDEGVLGGGVVRHGCRRGLGCQKARSPAVGVVTTLRQPCGPSRGVSSTAAPSRLARSVARRTSPSSTG
jgi:hypothetical protein